MNIQVTSSRKVGMRDINALLSAPISRIKTLRDDEGRRGFTLIELLVVVLIIGILAAIALPQYQKAVEKARLSEAITYLKTLEKATDVWLLENGGYPSSQVRFLGVSPQQILPVSLSGNPVGNTIRTSCFAYNAYCGDNYCDHIADRMVNGKILARLFQRKYGSSYVHNCEIRDNNSAVAHLICDEMQKKGWTTRIVDLNE